MKILYPAKIAFKIGDKIFSGIKKKLRELIASRLTEQNSDSRWKRGYAERKEKH